jgi:hypothetical protein
MSIYKRILSILEKWRFIPEKIIYIQEALGRIEARQMNLYNGDNLQKTEFKVYSQWGEDGIIQYILSRIPIKHKIFVEFGVENYTESNTRFLLKNNNWSGLVLDGNKSNVDYIKNDTSVYWAHNLKAENIFITIHNINKILLQNSIPEDLGLLSIDIDGNDYWIWDTIEVVKPRIIISEYNSLFGHTSKVSVPYSNDFVRSVAHYSNIYYGASIAALEFLAHKKGYSLIGCNMAGNNAFFVRNDLSNNFKILSAKEAYKPAQFRESKYSDGNLSYLNSKEQLNLISDLDLIDVESMTQIKVKDLIF